MNAKKSRRATDGFRLSLPYYYDFSKLFMIKWVYISRFF